MNWGQFKDHVSYRCLAGALVASCSLTQEAAGSIFFLKNILQYNIRTYAENSTEKSLETSSRS